MKQSSLLRNILSITSTSFALFFSLSIPAIATTVVSSGGTVIKVSSGVIPGLRPVPTAVVYTLEAHPFFGRGAGRFKAIGTPFMDASGLLGPDEHGTTGEGSAKSSVIQRGGNLLFVSTVVATVNPGRAENLPVSFTTLLSDPLVLNSDIGPLTIDVSLNSGTKFNGVPNELSIADDPLMTFRSRVTPGSDDNAETFFDPDPNALDIYRFDIIQSNTTGLIEASVSLGSSNSDFSLSFSDSIATIENRIENAFTGSAGNFEVLSDIFLFSVTATPLLGSDEEYTFGVGQNNFAPDVETTIPEPSSIISLLALGALGATSALKRKLKPKVPEMRD